MERTEKGDKEIMEKRLEGDLTRDQKAKADYGKEELTLVPRRIIHDICAIRMYGNQKYPDGGPDNCKQHSSHIWTNLRGRIKRAVFLTCGTWLAT